MKAKTPAIRDYLITGGMMLAVAFTTNVYLPWDLLVIAALVLYAAMLLIMDGFLIWMATQALLGTVWGATLLHVRPMPKWTFLSPPIQWALWMLAFEHAGWHAGAIWWTVLFLINYLALLAHQIAILSIHQIARENQAASTDEAEE